MIRICFVCSGNICRSPLAEYLLKKKIKDLNIEDKFYIESRAINDEEIGNDIYPPMREIMKKYNIPYEEHHATQLLSSDYDKFDYFICMDDRNMNQIKYIFDNLDKVSKLLDEDVSDPWYTRDFEKAYQDINRGVDILLEKIK